MFNFQGSELIIILLLALVVLGPEKLPEAMRRLGRFYADIKKMSSGFQEEFRAAVDEPTRELRDTANTLRDSLDFRKLQDGAREEKPKSAEMSSADPDPTPPADRDVTPPADRDVTPPADRDVTPPADRDVTPPADRDVTPPADPAGEKPPQPAWPILRQTSTPPAPPPPFSGSSPKIAPQVAVDDEHGLREARPADQDGAS